MPFMTILAVISIAVTVASTAYQIMQANKAKKNAKRAAEARKGFEIVVDGSSEPLPIVYGKAKIGGVRVYHNTSSSFKFVAPNSDKILQTGPPAIPSSEYTGVEYYNAEGAPIYGTVTIPARPDGLLTEDKVGEKNEFLFFQQALCQGPINAVWDVLIDDHQLLSDPTLGTYTGGETSPIQNVKAAMRIDVHNSGGVDSILAANFSERSSAKFTGTAYASVVIRLDRDNPQFSTVPNIQFMLEGRKVRSVTAGVLGGSYNYSNNPALCLLDYLLDSRSGKGLDVAEIDLASFEAAAAVCGTTAQSGVLTGGPIYQPVDGARNITTRTLPLYECNIVIDVSQPIRENVEAILSTMGDARLVWSAGKYHLILQYPITNEDIVVAKVLTDDDLLLEQTVEIKWPTTEERLNNVTIRFNNETEKFREDSVSWPPKVSGTTYRGVGGKKYPVVGGWDGDKPKNALLNSYGIWDGGGDTTTMAWKFRAPVTGTYALKFIADNSGTITVAGVPFTNNYSSVTSGSGVLTAGVVYDITISAANVRGPKGVAATLTAPDSTIAWTTRSDAYTSYATVVNSDAVYQAMLLEDGGVQLETDLFETGITDSYHALAKAEELVRTSRTAFAIKFQHKVTDAYLEPGDIIKLQSETLQLGFSGDVYIRVNEVKLLEGAIGEVTGTRFDYTQLAWAVKDDEYLKPANAYDFRVPAPEWITFTAEYNPMKNSSGTLKWAKVVDSRVVGYVLYVHMFNDMDSNGSPVFQEIGRSVKSPFYIPLFNKGSAIFGVKSITASGAMSLMTPTSMVSSSPLLYDPNIQRTVDISATGIAFVKDLAGSFNTATITLLANLKGFSAPTYKWYENDVVISGAITSSLVVPAFNPPQNKTFRVEVREALSPNNIFEGTDYITIFSVSEGSKTFNMTFSNESVNMLADLDGTITPPEQLPFNIFTTVARGATVLTSGVAFSKVDDGCTSTIDPITGDIQLTAVSQPYATITVTATQGSDVIARVISVNKNIQGSAITPRLVRLQTSNLAFVTPSGSGTPVPSSAEMLDASFGYDTPTREWYIDDVLQVGETGATMALPGFAAGLTKKITLAVSEADLSYPGIDEIVIFSIAEGSDAWSFTLTDLVKSIPCDSDGVVYVDVLPFDVGAIVYKGLANYTTGHSIVYSLENISGLTVSISSTTGVATVTAISAADSYFDIRATDPVSGASGAVRFTAHKVLDGADGADGPPGEAAYTLAIEPATKGVVADAAGVIKVGQLPFTVSTVAKKGLADIVYPAANFTIEGVPVGLTCSIDTAGVVTVTAMSGEEGSVTVRATEVSSGITGLTTFNAFKVRDGATPDVQAALTAGVTDVLAGVGGDYHLIVDAASGLVTIARAGLVYKGAATPGILRTGVGVSGSGIAMGYNRAVDGVWVDAIAISAIGDVSITGTLTASSVISTSVTVGGLPIGTISARATAGYNIQQALESSGETTLRGVLVPTATGALKTGSITWNSATGALTGGTGIAQTEYGIIAAASGTPTFTLNALTGAAAFSGDITGGANINITGQGVFGGAYTTAGYNAAIHANTSNAATNGIYTKAGSGGRALIVSATSPATDGALIQASGSGNTALEINGISSALAISATGVCEFNSTVNLYGGFTTGSSSLVTNLNADRLDSYHATSFCSIVPANTGSCTVSGQGFNLLVTGALGSSVRTRGTGNIVYIENISDRRLKQEIEDEVLGIEFINKLQPRSFRMRSDPARLAHGLIYQEVAEVIGEGDNLAHLNEDGIGGVDYNGLISPVIKSLQQLYNMQRKLEQQLSKLNKQRTL